MRLILATIMTLAAFPALAQSANVVGNAVVDGKRVELLSDRSWRYAETAQGNAGCQALNQVLQLCNLDPGWASLDTTGTEFIRQFRLTARNYGGIIYEELGSDDGLTLEFMRNAVIENAAMFTGVPASEIPVLDVATVSVGENTGERVVYGAKYNGLDIIYQNTILNAPNHNIQVVVWSVGKTLTDDALASNAAFLDAIDITFPQQ